jgi:recombination protein RecA
MAMTCAFVDAEHSMDPIYAAAIGVDTSALLLSPHICEGVP